MKKLIIAILPLFFLSLITTAQKVDNKKGVTYVDDTPLVKIKGGSLAVANQPAQILNYSNDKLLFTTTVNLLSSSTWYNQISFADFDYTFKTRHMYKPMIKSIYESGLFNEAGDMNREAVEKWFRLFGNPPPADWDF